MELPNRDLVLEAKAEEPRGVAWSSEGSISALLGSSRFGKSGDGLALSDASFLDTEAPRIARLLVTARGPDSARPAKRRGILPFLQKKLSPPPMRAAGSLADMVEVDADHDALIEDASQLEADGGMPADSLEERIVASLDLLERLLDDGSTRFKGPFRHHVRRLLEFLGDVLLTEVQCDQLADLAVRAES